jgi:hypothetical protein
LELDYVFHLVGALATLLRGAFALLTPLVFARRNGLAPLDALGRSELRAAYGALLASLGGFTLFVQDQVAFALLGAAWTAVAGVRVAAALLAGESDARVWRAALRDSAFAVMLLYPG